MIFSPRVPPRYAHVTAANGIASDAAQNASFPWSGREVSVRPSHPARKNTRTARTTETTVAMTAEVRTRGRTRPCSPRPTRIATSRTFATSMPKRVAVEAMNANCVATVTTPKIEAPSERVMTICVANVASTPAPSPITFWPAPPRMSRWSPNRPRGSTDSRAARSPGRRFAGRSPVLATGLVHARLLEVAQAAEMLLHLLGLVLADGLPLVDHVRGGGLAGPDRRVRPHDRRQDPPGVRHRRRRIERR